MAKHTTSNIKPQPAQDNKQETALAQPLLFGQFIGFILGIFGLWLGYKMVIVGKNTAGVAAMFTGLGIIIASICGKYFIDKEK